MTLTITLDENSAKLRLGMAAPPCIDPAVMAVRLIERSLRAAQPRTVFGPEMLKAYAAEQEAEDLALAESDLEHRAHLLAYEDEA